MGSEALFVFGKAINSRMSSPCASIAAVRSMPQAMPPWGGAPYSKASSMWPKRSFAVFGI